MTTKEEVAIRMAIDSRGVSAGLSNVSSQMRRFRAEEKKYNAEYAQSAGGFLSKSGVGGLKSMIKGTIITAVIAAIYDIIPDWEQIMQWRYKTDDERNQKIKREQERLRDMREKRDEEAAIRANKEYDDAMDAMKERFAQERRNAKELGDYQEQRLRGQLSLIKEIKDAKESRKKAVGESNLAFDDMSNISLGSASSIVDNAWGKMDMGDFRLSRNQMGDVRKAEKLQFMATQAKIDGNNSLAWDLTRQRLDLLKTMPWISDADRNPMRAMLDTLKETDKNMAELLAQAKSLGINVSIVAVPLKT